MAHVKRREIRTKVLQGLYAHEISKDPISKIKKDLLSEIVEEDGRMFGEELLDTVTKNNVTIDKYMFGKIKNWEEERISLLDKLILRMGICELLYFPEIPPKVTINEAIELAKIFCTKSSGKFVNGILDAVHLKLAKENKLNKTGRGLLNLKKKEEEEEKPSEQT